MKAQMGIHGDMPRPPPTPLKNDPAFINNLVNFYGNDPPQRSTLAKRGEDIMRGSS